ncbi:MAG: flagellar motor protein MotA [Hyphomicrobiales bacterium]|nr:flagellar motor protein MotA [Hyphomicrobiales bacterium]MDE2016232.1 flagellar motor protein MotA [Hyphomicrobiales bacterium]
MAGELARRRLSGPAGFLLRMALFLVIVGFVALILYEQIAVAFRANPGLNALILFVLALGILIAFAQVLRLNREIHWVNSTMFGPVARPPKSPRLLAPMATMLGEDAGFRNISTPTLRVILDSVASRLDEGRDVNRYLVNLLIFLGLLGTFWGLLRTVGSIAEVINSMQAGKDAGVMFDALKAGLARPIAGMSVSFTSSLFGLAGSLILGFLDLQAGQAQNRFFNELENALAATAADPVDMRPTAPAHAVAAPAQAALPPSAAADIRASLERLAAAADPNAQRAATAAMANLAEGIQGLVQHMRQEQQLIRDWVEAQSDQQQEVRALLRRLAAEAERR